MTLHPIFLSVVYVVRNQSHELEGIIQKAKSLLESLVSDYEVIIIDNCSEDESVHTLKNMTSRSGYPNLQVYVLTKEVDIDTATWAGLQNALGDFIAAVDPTLDDFNFLPQMIERAILGTDLVFATNQQKAHSTILYSSVRTIFNFIYKSFSGIDLAKEAPRYRLLSKKVINFILQHPQPTFAYRHLPARTGFSRVYLEYSVTPNIIKNKNLVESINRGINFLVSTTRVPMRIVTALSLFGAVTNLFYSMYVVAIAILKSDVTPGWISLSLQQSGMFFLISLVLLVLGEYILHMASLSNEGPPFHIGQEFTSATISAKEKLNVHDSQCQRSVERG